MLEKRDELFDLIKREILKQLGTNLPIGKVIETNKINHSGFSMQDIYDGLDYLEEKNFLKYYTLGRKRFMLKADGMDWVTGVINLPSAPKDEIVKLAPEIYGMGINLKALWRWIKKTFLGN